MGNSADITTKKLKNNVLVVLKSQDKREVLCLSTNHTTTTENIKRRGEEIDKPTLI